jgi:hypothetical protein
MSAWIELMLAKPPVTAGMIAKKLASRPAQEMVAELSRREMTGRGPVSSRGSSLL